MNNEAEDVYLKYLSSSSDIKNLIINTDVEIDYKSFSLAGVLFESEKYLYPAAAGFDVGCGVGVYKLVGVNKKKLERHLSNETVFGIFERRQVNHNIFKIGNYFSFLLNSIYEQRFGTLDKGNHFVEIMEDNQDNQYVIIHSGLDCETKEAFAYYFVKMYKESIGNIQNEMNGYKLKIPVGSKYFDDYIRCCEAAQEFSIKNRKYIAESIAEINDGKCRKIIDTLHEFINYQNGVVVHSNGVQQLREGKFRNNGIILSSADKYNSLISLPCNIRYFNHGTKMYYNPTIGRKYGNIDEIIRYEKDKQKSVKCYKRLRRVVNCKKKGEIYDYSFI